MDEWPVVVGCGLAVGSKGAGGPRDADESNIKRRTTFCPSNLKSHNSTTQSINSYKQFRLLRSQPQQTFQSNPIQSKPHSKTAKMVMTVAVCRVCDASIQNIAHLAYQKKRGRDDKTWHYFNIATDPRTATGLFAVAWRTLVNNGWRDQGTALSCPCH